MPLTSEAPTQTEVTIMNTTKRLLAATEDIWAGYHAHPFVLGIADGSLDQEKFQYYMIQDYLYLIEYAKVFAVGVAKAHDMETMRLFAGYIHQILDGEMDIHKAYMQRLGISPAEVEHTPVSLDTLSYTSYMLRVAYDEGPAEIAAAILSCALSYESIAKQIVSEHPAAADHPFYGEWVKGYADEGYHEANQVLIALTERLTADYSESRIQHLIEIFTACSRYEGTFWDMAWEMRP
ncbi:MAG: thiaminase II [Lachnospiraceae bacterium]|nr:thiaminase II [Lachnospiraceae bacterium]